MNIIVKNFITLLLYWDGLSGVVALTVDGKFFPLLTVDGKF